MSMGETKIEMITICSEFVRVICNRLCLLSQGEYRQALLTTRPHPTWFAPSLRGQAASPPRHGPAPRSVPACRPRWECLPEHHNEHPAGHERPASPREVDRQQRRRRGGAHGQGSCACPQGLPLLLVQHGEYVEYPIMPMEAAPAPPHEQNNESPTPPRGARRAARRNGWAIMMRGVGRTSGRTRSLRARDRAGGAGRAAGQGARAGPGRPGPVSSRTHR
jgi:hypothetical protein